MAKREGILLLSGSPDELLAKRKAKMAGNSAPAKPPAEPSDDSEGSKAAAVSALHELASALGVEVKDEDAALRAFSDLMNCGYSDEAE